MTRDDAKDFINSQEPTFLPKAAKKGYLCPYCNQGRNKGQGLTRKSDNKKLWFCIDCGIGRSVTGLFAGYAGIPDDPQHFPEILDRAASFYGITIDAEDKAVPRKTSKPKAAPEPPKDEEPQEDFTTYYRKCADRLSETDYLTRRGLSPEMGKRFLLGFCPDWINPTTIKNQRAKGSNWTPDPSPRLIIPTSKYGYTARDTRETLTKEQDDNKKQKVGVFKGNPPFNGKALKTAKSPIFVTEGEVNAMSIIEVGGEAVATGSASYTRIFVDYLLHLQEEGKLSTDALPLLISMDNDSSGDTATAKLKEELTKAEIPFQIVPVPRPHNDLNEFLLADRTGLEKWVRTYCNPALAYKESSVGNLVQDFVNSIVESANTPAISTGFNGLDKDLDGGLYEGLYTFGAISSLGKTSFTLQMCDQIAKGGHDVIIFALEMSQKELVAKSISRLSYELCKSRHLPEGNAKSTRGILAGARWKDYSKTEIDLIHEAANTYENYTKGRLWIVEGIGNIGVAEIRQRIDQHMQFTGNRPVILIDYLQILAPFNERYSDKQNVDKNVLELKRISRDYKIPIIIISSFNRDNYSAPVNLASFKESGAIEYSSDVLIGLQYYGMDYEEQKGKDGKIVIEGDNATRTSRIRALFKKNADDAKSGQAISIQLKVLKSRNGSKEISRIFDFHPIFNHFEEV